MHRERGHRMRPGGFNFVACSTSHETARGPGLFGVMVKVREEMGRTCYGVGLVWFWRHSRRRALRPNWQYEDPYQGCEPMPCAPFRAQPA
jgi:hypothetical protein